MPRPTPVRDAVRQAIFSGYRHAWNLDELVHALKSAGLQADASSVFRALGALEADGAIRRIDLGDGRSHFEPAGDHHEHICCERCGIVIPVPGCLLDDIEEHILRTTGFTLSGHSVLLKGICSQCQT